MLTDYVLAHTKREACQCGKCFDAPENPKEHQPAGHTADLVFFKVAQQGTPQADEFLKLVKTEHPNWLDGKEHGYMEIGADLNDQGIALLTMGLGSLLGTWNLLTPRTMLPASFPDEIIMKMAGQGLISIQVRNGAD